MTTADRVRAASDPYAKAVASMTWRDTSTPFKVVFHFADDSTVTFKKEYKLEELPSKS